VISKRAILRPLALVFAFLCFAPAALAPAAFADSSTELYFQQVIERYFEHPQSARTFGMGGSTVVTSTDSSSVFGNPAGIGLMPGGELSGSYSYNTIGGDEFPTGREVSQKGSMGSALLAVPIMPTTDGLPEWGNFGLAWDSYDTKWHDDTFDTDSERTQVTAAYAYALSDKLSLGYSFGWTDDHFQSKDIFNYPMGDGFRHTFGSVYKVDNDLTLGSSLFFGYGTHHALFGPGIKGNSDTSEFGFDLGGTYKIDQTLLALAADYRHLGTDGEIQSSIPANVVGGDENGNLFDIRLGVEQQFTDWFYARAGYRYAGLASYKYSRIELNGLNGSAYYNAWSLGAGFVIPLSSQYFKSVKIDYGVEYRATSSNDWQHLVTLSLPFNLCRPL
jgi:hypothetical protein